jgi:hypothetical protein
LVFHCLQKEYKAVKYDKCARLHSSCSAHTCVVCGRSHCHTARRCGAVALAARLAERNAEVVVRCCAQFAVDPHGHSAPSHTHR